MVAMVLTHIYLTQLPTCLVHMPVLASPQTPNPILFPSCLHQVHHPQAQGSHGMGQGHAAAAAGGVAAAGAAATGLRYAPPDRFVAFNSAYPLENAVLFKVRACDGVARCACHVIV